VAEQGWQKRKSKATANSKSTSKAKFVCGHFVPTPLFLFGLGVRYARTDFGFAVDLLTPVHRLDLLQTSGGVR